MYLLRASLHGQRLLRSSPRLVQRPVRYSTSSYATPSSPATEDEAPKTQQSFNDVLPEDPLSTTASSPTGSKGVDWSRSFHGLSSEPFSAEIAKTLMSPLDEDSIEIKPDGLLYLPEIKYRRILNTAFGPGGWGLAPRGETYVTDRSVSREYALICHGRLVSVARGEQEYFGPEKIATATEGCKSNALMRCCKDLGVASELWDPSFIRSWKRDNCVEQFVEHQVSKKRKKLWRRKDMQFEYPYKVAQFS